MIVAIAVVRRETARAVQVILRPYPYPIVWLPKSQIEAELHAGDRDVEVEVPEWLMRQKLGE